MATRLSRERAVTSALDHLHTPAPALARFASKVAVDAAPTTRIGATRSGATTSGVDVGPPTVEARPVEAGRRAPRWRLAAALAALLFTGFSGATFAGNSASSKTIPAPNSVFAIGAAPRLGSGADLELHAGVVAMASNPVRPGYWLAAADGGVFAFGDASFFGSTGGTTLNAPVVGIAATPRGRGYWLVGADGGVFAFGDADYHGSLAGKPLAAPISSIIATRRGDGYWLVGADGGVFSFGDAQYFGSAQTLDLRHPIVGAAATRTGKGYWLVGAGGGVFSFGDARFAGALRDSSRPAVGIAASRRGRGYWIAHADGSVSGFNVSPRGNNAFLASESEQSRTVAIATSSQGGYWLAQGAALGTDSALSSDPFLACTRAHESDRAGGYQAVSADGTYRGAYQFDRSTWNNAALIANRPDLVGVDPAAASPADQDLLALDLYHAHGAQPWGGRCAGLS